MLDEQDGTDFVKKIDQAAFVTMYVKNAHFRHPGNSGTRWRSAGDVLWLIQYFAIVLATVAIGVVLVGLRFILVPLVMSYFVTFLLAPLADVFVRRPHPICGRSCGRRCSRYQHTQLRRQLAARRCCGASVADAADFFVLLKLPHPLAVLCTLLTVALGLFALSSMLYRSASKFLEQKGTIISAIQNYTAASVEALNQTGIEIDGGAHAVEALFGLTPPQPAEVSAGFRGTVRVPEQGYDLGAVLQQMPALLSVGLQLGLVLALAVLLLLNRGGNSSRMLSFGGSG